VDTRIEERAAVPTAVWRGALDLPRFIDRLQEVYAALGGRKGGQNIARYDGDGTMEVGVEIEGFDAVGDIVPSTLPGGRVAVAVHTTGYATIHVTGDAIRAWCAAHDETLAGPSWEIYGDPDERDHVDVEVCYLLA
jgi:effector-binding domain-containing protein